MTKRILIASVLKPVNDARMYKKIGKTLSGVNNTEIHIAGFWKRGTGNGEPEGNIQQHSIFSKSRLHISRLFVNFRLLRLIFKIRPALLIITTFELLPASFIARISGTKVIYDVQENYYRNLVYTNSFPPVIKHIFAFLVRIGEWKSRLWVNHYLLAEKNYEKEFSFSKGKSTILENKYQQESVILPEATPKKEGAIRLLYSGTIAENYGIFEAIFMAKHFHRINKNVEMLIVGYAAQPATLELVKELTQYTHFIHLVGGDTLVPHERIVAEIKKADIGLVCYRPNKSTENCIPTKLYEYLALKLPVLVQENPIWSELVQQYNAGISLNYMRYAPEKILQSIISGKFYTSNVSAEELIWEKNTLIHLVQPYLNATKQ